MPSDTSTPVTWIPGQRATAAAARAPVPEPMSRRRVAPAATSGSISSSTSRVAGRWIGDHHSAYPSAIRS